MSAPFSHDLRVRYSECDAQGCVFNAQYLSYLDVVVTEFWRAALGSYSLLIEEGVDMMVAEASVRYRAPVRFDEVISIAVTIERLGETSMTTGYRVSCEHDLRAEGRLRHVFVDAEHFRKHAIPDRVRAALEPYLPTVSQPR